MGSDRRLRWAPKLRTDRLIRLYEANAAGLLEPDLVDDVGWRLWERLADVVLVSQGRIRCPDCRTEFQVRIAGQADDVQVGCPGCGWSISPRDWHRSWEHQDLNGNCPDFERFVGAYPQTRGVRDRMVLIDGVVHALHLTAMGDVSNFAARNFIEGSRPKIVALLEELAHGDGAAVADGARQRWEEARRRYRSGGRGSQ